MESDFPLRDHSSAGKVKRRLEETGTELKSLLGDCYKSQGEK